jgi:hypothetical protein
VPGLHSALSVSIAVAGEDEGVCPLVGVASVLEGDRGGEQLGAVGSEERFGTLGGGARDQVAIGVRFGLREVAAAPGLRARTAASARSAATHGYHSSECHERLPPSPVPRRSTAGLRRGYSSMAPPTVRRCSRKLREGVFSRFAR